MTGVYLDDIVMKRESKSFTDSLYAILTAADLFSGPKYLLSGLSGMAFKFTAHERLLPMSVSAYGQWGNEHQPAVNNLGVFTEYDAGRTRHPTFQYYQKEAVQGVISSLKRGLGVIYWIPEFGVIHGYDDEDRVFFVQDGCSKESQVILYDNFGLNFTPFWYYQIFGEKVEIEQNVMILESLRLAIDDWETPYKTLPNRDIASGKLAYTFLIRGLEKRDYDESGAVYILDSYVYARTEIMNYLHDARRTLAELDEAYMVYAQLIAKISGIKGCIIETKRGRQVDRKRISNLIEMLRTAETLEELAMSEFRAISKHYPDLKRSTVPRWGLNSAR